MSIDLQNQIRSNAEIMKNSFTDLDKFLKKMNLEETTKKDERVEEKKHVEEKNQILMKGVSEPAFGKNCTATI